MKILFQFVPFTSPQPTAPSWTTLTTRQWTADDYDFETTTRPSWTTARTTWPTTTAWPTATTWPTTTWQTTPIWPPVTTGWTTQRPATTRQTTYIPFTTRPVTVKPSTVKPTTIKPVTLKPSGPSTNCTSTSSSLPQESTLLLGVGLLLVLGVVSLIGIQFYTLFSKKSESLTRSHPYRGPARRPSPEYQIAERVYPGLPSYEARPSETRFSDVSSSTSDFDLKGLPHGNEVPITKNKRYFTLQKAKKSTTSVSGIPRIFKSNKISFKKSPDWYRRDNLPGSDETYP